MRPVDEMKPSDLLPRNYEKRSRSRAPREIVTIVIKRFAVSNLVCCIADFEQPSLHRARNRALPAPRMSRNVTYRALHLTSRLSASAHESEARLN